jgi:MFS family permease
MKDIEPEGGRHTVMDDPGHLTPSHIGYNRANHLFWRRFWGYITALVLLFCGWCALFFGFLADRMSQQAASGAFSGIALMFMSSIVVVPLHLFSAVMLARAARKRPESAIIEISVVLGFTLVEAVLVGGFLVYLALYFRPG